MVNRSSFAANTRVENEILTLEPFARDHIGTYKCTARNLYLSSQTEISKRIHINVESKKKRVVDVSNKIAINILSSVDDYKDGGTIKLKCTLSKF